MPIIVLTPGQITGPRNRHVIQDRQESFPGICKQEKKEGPFFLPLGGKLLECDPRMAGSHIPHWMMSQEPLPMKDLAQLLRLLLALNFGLSAFRNCLSYREPLHPKSPLPWAAHRPINSWLRLHRSLPKPEHRQSCPCTSLGQEEDAWCPIPKLALGVSCKHCELTGLQVAGREGNCL